MLVWDYAKLLTHLSLLSFVYDWLIVKLDHTEDLCHVTRGGNWSFFVVSSSRLVKSIQPRDGSLPAQPISVRKAQARKKAHKPLRTPCTSQTNLSSMFDHQNLVILIIEKQTFRILSLRDLCFVFCSRDLDVLRAQRIIGFFIFTHRSTGSEI